MVLTTAAWTDYTIATSAFAGVNLTAVTGMTIGVGNPQGSPSGAAGLLLIDDIQIGVKPIGLVAYYKLEGNLDDSSGNGHNGTLAGNASSPRQVPSRPDRLGPGPALRRDRSATQNVQLGHVQPLGRDRPTHRRPVGEAGTVASDQWQGLIGKRDAWAANDMMWHVEVNRDNGTIGFARTDVYPDSGGATLPLGTWAHVAVTFDGTTATFYLNGVRTGSGSFSFGLDTQAALHFGSDDPNGGNAFDGALDEIRIYDQVLTGAEILKLAGK